MFLCGKRKFGWSTVKECQADGLSHTTLYACHGLHLFSINIWGGNLDTAGVFLVFVSINGRNASKLTSSES